MEECTSTRKITRSFVVNADIFASFKEIVASEGYSNFSEIIEHLILCYLKNPNSFDFRKSLK